MCSTHSWPFLHWPLALCAHSRTVFEIPMPSIILKLKEPHTMSRSQKFLIWLSDILLMRKALFDHLTARGIQVYIWVLNEEQEYKGAFDLGATAVMTDYPTKLKDFLHNFSA